MTVNVDGESQVQFDLTRYIMEPKTTDEPEIEFVPLDANWTRWNWRSPA